MCQRTAVIVTTRFAAASALAVTFIAGMFVAGMLLAGTGGMPARADQADPRLDPLFEALASTPDARHAAAISDRIWGIWLESGDEETDELVRQGMVAAHTGLLDLAIELFGEVTERQPDFAEGWNKRATALYLAGRLDESAADVVRTLELEPRHFGALSGMGAIEVARGRPVEAIGWYERALDVHPNLQSVRETLRRLREKVRAI